MKFILLLLLAAQIGLATAQNKVLGILGSSTAQGVGASTPANAWVNKLSSYYSGAGVLSSTVNLARLGYNPYHAMPTGYTPPAGRPAPVPDSNITRLLTVDPDVVIISFANNNYNTYSIAEIKTTLQVLYAEAVQAGKTAYVTTTQPRTSFSQANREKLRDIKDSIIQWFGIYSINFFDPIADPADLSIRAEYRFSGDEIHLNDAGHDVLFNQVLARNIFATVLTSRLTLFTVKRHSASEVRLSWTVNDAGNSRYTVERSEGNGFTAINTVASSGSGTRAYAYTDSRATGSTLQYRIRINTGNSVSYSSILIAANTVSSAVLQVRGNPVKGQLQLLAEAPSDAPATLRIFDTHGRLVQQRSVNLRKGSNLILVDMTRLSGGQYIAGLQIAGQYHQAIFQKQ